MLDNVQESRLLLREFFIAAMLNPSLKSRFMREPIAGLVLLVGL